MAITFNYNNDEIVSSPTVIINGRTSTGISRGIISFTNNDNKVFPPQHFEVNTNGNFKAVVHVSPGESNKFKVEVADNGRISPYGFPEYDGGRGPRIVDSGSLTLTFNPLPQNKPVHLCLIRGKDSRNTYDMPKYKLQRGEIPSLEMAIKKMKVMGRIMQAFTQEEMRTFGLSNRSFQFVEETVSHQGIFGYDVHSPTPHQEVKIHVLTSDKTVAELRDPDYAQQNPKAKQGGWLFGHAVELIKRTPEIYNGGRDTAVQCACIYLDSTFDTKMDLILTHTALGGGTGEVQLGIFGSHGLHSWPHNFPSITPCFLDSTPLSKKEVANDCNECGTSWECLNITFGAFFHEVGHSLGCPHQVNGMMLRDYVRFNRSVMTRELECKRTGSSGKQIGADGKWPEECHWHKLDLIRFFYHDCFSLPIDQFPKIFESTIRPNREYPDNQTPSSSVISSNSIVIKSNAGIFLVEVITDGLARYHRAWYPPAYGGGPLPKQLTINYDEYLNELRRADSGAAREDYDIRILSLGQDLYINNLKETISKKRSDVIKGDFGLNRGTIIGFKSDLLGQSKDKQMQIAGFNLESVYKVRIYHGGALDGVKFYFRLGGGAPAPQVKQGGKTPPVPPRNYLSSFVDKMKKLDVSGDRSSSPSNGGVERTSLVGHEKSDYSEYVVNPGEYITKFILRNGAWVDAIQFETNKGTRSPMFGNAGGGHESVLEAPSDRHRIVGMYFYLGDWLDGLGAIFEEL
ncbi:uncharacterized protein J8A68_003222 [[Candida] subhashii]|uniref:Jacalin-type lectin domain-containing protein n=1 Tax=[Candida] subhashii TaxID=561895 RepID=A0A8J5QHN7_9ASCO|nr:uncharacterized protein J8A68_003222 [[Candida] subhashii]KAG7663222.1 hypothetical protein J8A68_003222 [[Candida] subhashii]